MDLSDDEEETIIMLLAYRHLQTKRKRRFWEHEIVKGRKEKVCFNNLILRELYMDEDQFILYLRLTREQFSLVLHFIGSDLTKGSRYREVICPRQRLAICLRYLATGESFASLAYSYRCGKSTVGNIVREVCDAIWSRISGTYMKMPQTPDEWELKSENFKMQWNFPHCVGAIDGKHIGITCPRNSGSMYYYYKGTFSLVLMAMVDANLQFTAIYVGAYGRNSNSGVFGNSEMGIGITNDTLNFPKSKVILGAERLGPLPYVVVGDAAFPLHEHIMRPYAGRGCAEDQQIFNYRLSRARRIVENAFGILAARWRVFHSKIATGHDATVGIVKSACVLHNMIQANTTPAQCTQVCVTGDSQAVQTGILPLQPAACNRGSNDAKGIRDLFKVYFIEIDQLPWQQNVVQRGKD